MGSNHILRTLFALAALSPWSAFSQTAAESQRIYRSSYHLGRGDTGIANADNHEALFYNPAGLALGDGIYKETVLISPHFELSKDTKDLVRKVVIEKENDPATLAQHEGKNQHLGIYNFTGIVLRRAAIGAVVSNQTNILVRKNYEQTALTTVSADTVANRAVVFGVAEQFLNEQLLVGLTYKYMMRDSAAVEFGIADATDIGDKFGDDVANSATGSGVDLGLMYRMKSKVPLNFGLTVTNAGNTTLTGNSESDHDVTLKQQVNFGMVFEPQTKFSRMGLYLDYHDVLGEVDTSVFRRLHLGAELAVRKFVGFTAGLNQGYPTLGAFLNLYVVRFDLGGYAEEMDDRVGVRPDVRYFFRIMAGF